jgi:hypothetical protein
MRLGCIVTPRYCCGDPETFHRCIALVEHLSAVIFVKELFKLVVIRSEFLDEYQICLEFHGDHVHQSSAFLHISTKSYESFRATLLAVQIN